MRLGPWVIYLFVILLCLTLLGLGGAGYLLFQQHLALERLTKDTKRLRLSTQSLETMLSQGQGWSRLSQPRPGQPPQPKAKTTSSTVAKSTTSTTTTTTLPPSPALVPAASPQAGENGAAQAQGAQGESRASVSHGLEPEPGSTDWVAIRNVRQSKSGGRLTVRFEVANKKEGQGQVQAEGYVTVVLRGSRKGGPWLEAWPPARLSPLGRPENYKRGKPFAVKRYRTLKARFAVADKYLEQLEFVVYDQQGKLVMMRKVDITIKQKRRPN